jgi:hypothetical protein
MISEDLTNKVLACASEQLLHEAGKVNADRHIRIRASRVSG